MVATLAFYASHAIAQLHEPVLALAKKEQPALLQTMKELVEIESGSRELEELDKIANVLEDAGGGFTGAANASLKTQAPVIEGFGLNGFGAHTTNAEYIFMSSIEPRLYLTTRMIMDISNGKAPLK